jgi:hypothetical protein
VDVLAIGTSNVYSAVEPMRWWEQLGCTGYAWGEPAQRIYDTYNYLKKIYRVQSPRVVFLEVGNLYRDRTDAQNLDSLVKTHLADLYPLVAYHRNLAPKKFSNWGASTHSLTKGYMLRQAVKGIDPPDYMAPTDAGEEPNFLSRRELEACIALCKKQGSRVVLVAIPDSSAWSMARHNTVAALAKNDGIDFLDLNVDMSNAIDWSTDTADGGVHLNCRGAAKVTDFLAAYLQVNCSLPDHRGDGAYSAWAEDSRTFDAKMRAAGVVS